MSRLIQRGPRVPKRAKRILGVLREIFSYSDQYEASHSGSSAFCRLRSRADHYRPGSFKQDYGFDFRRTDRPD